MYMMGFHTGSIFQIYSECIGQSRGIVEDTCSRYCAVGENPEICDGRVSFLTKEPCLKNNCIFCC